MLGTELHKVHEEMFPVSHSSHNDRRIVCSAWAINVEEMN